MMQRKDIFLKLTEADIKNLFNNKSTTLDEFPYIFNIHFVVDYLERHPNAELNQIFSEMEIKTEKERRKYLSELFNKKIKIDKIWKNKELKENYYNETRDLIFKADPNIYSKSVVEQLEKSSALQRTDRRTNGVFFSVDYIIHALHIIPKFEKPPDGKIKEKIKNIILNELETTKTHIVENREDNIDLVAEQNNIPENIILKKIPRNESLLFGNTYEKIDTKNNVSLPIKIFFIKLQPEEIDEFYPESVKLCDFPYIINIHAIANYLCAKYSLLELQSNLQFDKEVNDEKTMRKEIRELFHIMCNKFRKHKTSNIIKNNYQKEHKVIDTNLIENDKEMYNKQLVEQIKHFHTMATRSNSLTNGQSFFAVDYLIEALTGTYWERSVSSQALRNLILAVVEEAKNEITQLNNAPSLNQSNILVEMESQELDDITKDKQLKVFIKLEEEDINHFYPHSLTLEEVDENNQPFPYVVNILSLASYWLNNPSRKEKIEDIFKKYKTNRECSINCVNVLK